MLQIVGFPWVRPDVQDAEDGHFYAKEECWDADFDVGDGEALAFFDDVRGGQEIDDDLDTVRSAISG